MTANAPTVLLVEDHPNDARLVQRVFSSGLEVPVFPLQNGDEAGSCLLGDALHDNRVLHPMHEVLLLGIKLPPFGLEG